jgi:hypothetical protein
VISSHPFPFKQIHKDCVGEFGFSLFLPITLLAKRKEKKRKRKEKSSQRIIINVYPPPLFFSKKRLKILPLCSYPNPNALFLP